MKYIAVDCGKYDTKTAAFDGGIRKFKYRTKIGPGIFEDDMIKRGTMIAQVDGGDIVTFGYGAQAEPSMETTKKTDVHRIATLISVAVALGNGTFDDVNVAIGVPLDVAGNASDRMEYKDYILGKEGVKHEVLWKKDSDSPICKTVFTFKKRFVYPEGCGALWMFPDKCLSSTAIIDIGNLNTNNVYAEGLNPEDSMCFTGELGGKVLIAGLTQALEAELGSRVSESMVAQVLTRPQEKRHLVSAKGDKSVEERSAKVIADYAMQHVRMIRQQCDLHHWPLDFATVICVGGTTKLLSGELAAVFGDTVFIPEAQEYVNVEGFLKRMCASLGVDTEKE